VGEGIEGLVHISEMAAHHVESPDQVVTAGEELWVKIIELDTARRRISLSIKQAAEGGEVSEEYREAFGSHAYDSEGNYIGAIEYGEFTPETEAQAAWAEYAVEVAPKTDDDDVTASEVVDDAEVTDVVDAVETPEAETPGAETPEADTPTDE
jgi:small subunit ribosomal protein S1